jgi:hypothetical protein
MRITYLLKATGITAALCAVAATAVGQEDPDAGVEFYHRNLGGPRLGVTFVTGHAGLWNRLDSLGMGRLVSQFGWHFEYQVVPHGGGPQFVIQLVPMLGAVEYGTVVPTGNLVMGIRFPNGFEFGMGPNVMVTGGAEVVQSGLLMGIGKSFDYGGVSIPINLVYVHNPEGGRVSVIFGYAIRTGRRR